MYNPFQETIVADVTDEDLVLQAQHGDWDALEQLIGRHQAWIFNIAVRMVRKPQEAEDITQEVLLKMLTKLGTFQGKSSFRTWLYRIVVNHVLNLHQRPKELTFSELGMLIEHLPDQALPDAAEVSLPLSVLVEEAKVGCTLGMSLPGSATTAGLHPGRGVWGEQRAGSRTHGSVAQQLSSSAEPCSA
jgi:RNA polymerase sigma factor (sigma-70 family)